MSKNSKTKKREEKIKKTKKQDFKCCHCFRQVSYSKTIGTAHRNHCPFCLWSKHVDFKKPGDRKSNCKSKMMPIGLTFKQEGIDKYGRKKQGELMVVHQCFKCKKISINRIAGDDMSKTIFKVLKNFKKINPEEIKQIEENNIKLLRQENKQEIFKQLFGRE